MENPRKYEKFMLLVIGVVLSLLLALALVQYFSPPSTIQKNYIGQKGDQGDSIQGPQGLSGPQGIQGLQGIKGDTGAQGVTGAKGNAGATGSQGVQGDVGPTGAPGDNGQDGKQIEFRCAPNHNYQFRYIGDEGWQNIQKNSLACQSPS